MRLIDSDALKEKISEAHFKTYGNAMKCIIEAPTVDAVPVVRCKECKKGHPELAPNGGVWCAVWNHVFCDDGFCACGERGGVT